MKWRNYIPYGYLIITTFSIGAVGNLYMPNYRVEMFFFGLILGTIIASLSILSHSLDDIKSKLKEIDEHTRTH